MPKGKTNNPKGRPVGAKAKPKTHLAKVYSLEWLRSIGQAGYNEWANANPNIAHQIAAKFVPQQVGFDEQTCFTLASMLGGK